MYESLTIGAPSQYQSTSSQQSFDDFTNPPDIHLTPALNAPISNVVLPPPSVLRVSSSRDRSQESSRSPSPIRRLTHQRTLTEDVTPKRCLPSLATPKQPAFGLGISGHPATVVSSLSNLPEPHSLFLSQNSPLPSPSKERLALSEEKLAEFEKETIVEHKRGGLANWFRGESDAINIGIIPSPSKEKSNPMPRPSTPMSVPQSVASTPTKPLTTMRPSAPTMGLFSFLGSKVPQPTANDSKCIDDKMTQLDVKRALLPGGPADPFSPSSFKNLMQNAEGLLSRMQNALKQRTAALHEVTVEKEAQSEELEEAQTRARHLKLQLDDMSAKMTEQDQMMMNLIEELAHEKQARRDDEEFRKRTIRIVDATNQPSHPRPHVSRTSTISRDSGFESDEDSLFSPNGEVESPTTTISTTSLQSPTSAEFPSAARFPPPVSSVVKGGPVAPAYSCANCHGIRGSEAWNVVDVLKAENQGLKHRVGELESALDGCLDMVNGLG